MFSPSQLVKSKLYRPIKKGGQLLGNWVVGGQLSQGGGRGGGGIWKLGVSIMNPPPPNLPLKKSLMFNYKGGANGAWDKMSVKCLVEGG